MANTRRTRRVTPSPVEELTVDIVDQLVDQTDSTSVVVDTLQPTSTPANNLQVTRSRNSGRLAELNALLERYGVLLDARDVYAKYASILHPSEYRGLWRIDGKKTIRLTDCYIEVLRIVKPMSTSTSRDYSVTLRFTNPHDKTLELTLSRYDIDEDMLSGHFLAFGSLPETTLHKQFLLEAIKEIMKAANMLCQLQTDALGWYSLEDGTLVWLLVNGVEKVTGFLSSDTAPFVAPTFISPGNGYHGDTVDTPTDGVMHLLLEQLLPNGQILIASLLGLAARVMIPIPGDDTPGMLRFCSEIIGPPRHGKSRLLNAILSLFGTHFDYDRGTLLNEHGGSDTKIGRLGLSSIMRYCLFGDFDHKVVPGHNLFEKIHTLRAATNNIYADDTGGGTVGTQKGGMRARFKPTGGLIRTSNYDHADYSLRHDEENIEARVCSFLWPKDNTSITGYVQANDAVSHELEKQRIGIYTWGVYYRRWIMHMHNEELSTLVEEKRHQARELVYSYMLELDTWGCDLHRNQCVDIVLGLLMWKQFTVDQFPTSFMMVWLDTMVNQVINDRLTRCIYVHTVAGKYTVENKLNDFVLTTIRYMFQSQQCYITKKGRLLLPLDVEYSLEQLGYKRVIRAGKQDNYEPGQHEIGCLTQDDKVAFDKTALYDALLRESDKAHVSIPDQATLIKQLVELGVVISDSNNKSTFPVKYHSKTRRMILIALDTIYPSDVDEAAIPINIDDTPDNIRQIKPSSDTELVANF